MSYDEFVRNKAAFVTYYGFDVDDHETTDDHNEENPS